MEIRRLELSDEAAFRQFQDILLEEKVHNPFIETKKVDDFPAYIAKCQQNEVDTGNPDWATSTNFYYFLDGEIVARIGCRWELKGTLATVGGHIGYVTRTDYRGRGIMKKLLAFALEKYADRGIEEVLITARKDNMPSRGTIEHFNARFDGYVDDNGHKFARYWVKTS